MTKGKAWKFKGGNYFMVSAGAVKAVAQQTSSVEAVLAYLVLCGCKQKGTVGATGGANKVATALRISRPQAAKVIDLLKTVSWGETAVERAMASPKDWNDSELGDAIPEKEGIYDYVALPPLGDLDYYLDNDFLSHSDGRFTTGIGRLLKVPKKERLDAVLLYLELVESYSLSEHGGIDPRIISRPWETSGQIDLARYGKASGDIRFFLACEPAKSTALDVGLANRILNLDAGRLRKAFNNLLSVGIMLEVPTVFSQPPLDDGYEVQYAVDAENNYDNILGAAERALHHIELKSELLTDEIVANRKVKVFASATGDAAVRGVFRLNHLNNSSYYLRDKLNDDNRIEKFKNALDELISRGDEESFSLEFDVFESQAAV